MSEVQPEKQSAIAKDATRSVGRPKAITHEVVQKLMDSFDQGMDVTSACLLSGISTSTYYNELARNQRFMDKMTVFQNQPTLYANLVVTKAIKRGDLKTAKWWIERQDRLALHAQNSARYRRKKKLTLKQTHADKSSRTMSMEVTDEDRENPLGESH